MNNLPTAARRLPTASRRQPTATRRGFTLIELMIVITIIAVLASILIPAVNAVMTRARLATVTAEMQSIETAIADFEGKFGRQPPSYANFVPSGGKLPAATSGILRSMFPEINLDVSTATSPLRVDLTRAGLWNKELYGPEALVFYLGGVRKHNDLNANGTVETGEWTNEMIGFSKNPARPFAQPASTAATRTGPFTEFDSGRLGEVTRPSPGKITLNTNLSTFDGTPLAYMDSLEGQTSPIMYVSTSRTNSYAPTDSGLFPLPAAPPYPWTPYQKSAGNYYNPKSFQLISPGYDGEYGKGGVYNEDATLDPADRDNLTNFTEGQIGG